MITKDYEPIKFEFFQSDIEKNCFCNEILDRNI